MPLDGQNIQPARNPWERFLDVTKNTENEKPPDLGSLEDIEAQTKGPWGLRIHGFQISIS